MMAVALNLQFRRDQCRALSSGSVFVICPASFCLRISDTCSIALKALLLTLRLWGRCSSELVSKCPLLPAGVQPPAKDFFAVNAAEASDHPAAVAEAFFAGTHLEKILLPLRLSSSSHPRLHSLWPTLLALLIPGFTASKVR